MNWLVGIVPGLVATATLVAFMHGYRLLRSDPAEGLDVEDIALFNAPERRRASGQGPLGRLASRLTPELRRRLPLPALRWLQKQVNAAGRSADMDVDSVLKQVVMWGLILLPVAVLYVMQGNLIMVLLAIVAALILPLGRLTRQARLRREQLDRDLPDFLDVLAVTVSAGVAFRPALRVVSERFGGPLAEEFALVLNQIANGASVRGAFIQLRERNDSQSLQEFVTAYLQAEELGAPLADTLNQIAMDMRKASAQRMRQKAGRTAPRVTLVSSVVLVPGVLILLLVGMYLGSDIDFQGLLG